MVNGIKLRKCLQHHRVQIHIEGEETSADLLAMQTKRATYPTMTPTTQWSILCEATCPCLAELWPSVDHPQ